MVSYDNILLMEPDIKRLVELAEENNKMLHKIRNVQKIATFWHVLKFILIIALALGSLYYIEPYLTKVLDIYDSLGGLKLPK